MEFENKEEKNDNQDNPCSPSTHRLVFSAWSMDFRYFLIATASNHYLLIKQRWFYHTILCTTPFQEYLCSSRSTTLQHEQKIN